METFYQRNLPHWVPASAVFFITFRLANSLPESVLRDLANEKERERQAIINQLDRGEQKNQIYDLEKRYFGYFDNWLDKDLESSPHWLSEEQIAQVVARAFHDLDGKHFTLLAYCIMPNHVHLLIDTVGYEPDTANQNKPLRYPLVETLKLLKGRTAREANQILKRTGCFWQHESYDHIVRDAGELERIVEYILTNPVKAGLAGEWQAWPHSWTKYPK